jgi:hypothetical protein
VEGSAGEGEREDGWSALASGSEEEGEGEKEGGLASGDEGSGDGCADEAEALGGGNGVVSLVDENLESSWGADLDKALPVLPEDEVAKAAGIALPLSPASVDGARRWSWSSSSELGKETSPRKFV